MKSNLKKILTERKLSLSAFGRLTKLNRSTVTKVFNNDFDDITMRVFRTMCICLSCQFNDLIDTSDLDISVHEKKTRLKAS